MLENIYICLFVCMPIDIIVYILSCIPSWFDFDFRKCDYNLILILMQIYSMELLVLVLILIILISIF